MIRRFQGRRLRIAVVRTSELGIAAVRIAGPRIVVAPRIDVARIVADPVVEVRTVEVGTDGKEIGGNDGCVS